MFDRVLDAPLVFYGIAILKIIFAGVFFVLKFQVVYLLHHFTRHFAGARVYQIVHKYFHSFVFGFIFAFCYFCLRKK